MESAEVQHELNRYISDSYKVDFKVGSSIDVTPNPTYVKQEFEQAIFEYFNGVYDILRSCLSNDLPPSIQKKIFGLSRSIFGRKYHKSLSHEHLKKPVFFRTDEPTLGQVVELQCPGSLWGEYLLLLSTQAPQEAKKFLDHFTSSIETYNSSPKVHHLLDNASRPATMIYFIQKIRDSYEIPFLGFDNIKSSEANFIRSHSFFGLAAQNHFFDNLKRVQSKEIKFDYPPTPIFDQKYCLCLPFMKETRFFFSDIVRKYIVPSYSLNIDLTFEDENGTKHSLYDLMNQPRSKRDYYIKYAGQDTTRNWGGMRVRSLSKISKQYFSELEKEIKRDLLTNDPWIIQRNVSSRSSGDEINMYAKYSSFFNDKGVIGTIAHLRDFHVVHGQKNTVNSIARILYDEK